MVTFIGVLVFAFLANILGTIFGRKLSASGTLPILIAISAGFVIGVALLHLAPELAELDPHAFKWSVVAFFVMYVIEHYFAPHFHHADVGDCQHEHQKGWVTFIGFAIHALFDGLVIGAAFAADSATGWIVASGVLLHKFPEGMMTFSSLKHFGYAEKYALYAAFAVALLTPIGAFSTFVIGILGAQETLNVIMALAFGALLYVGMTDLLPQVAHQKGYKSTALLFLGLGFAYLIALFGHHH